MRPAVNLVSVAEEDYDDFIERLQAAFTQAARARFPEFLGNIPPQRDIDEALDEPHAEMLSIVYEGNIIGGAVITGGTTHKVLEFFFIDPERQNLNLGQAAWQAIEARYPETKTWELVTAYHEKRNIHFYVNKCGFHIVEFFNSRHPDPHDPETGEEERYEDGDGMFRFEKRMRSSGNGMGEANG